MEKVEIDGSFGQGGGQILRTSLSLACITGKHLYMKNIRANRPRPGLRKQHLVCVEAAKLICNAKCSEVQIGSSVLEFKPEKVVAGNYNFDIGSAGSVFLVMQTILPVLFTANEKSNVTITGGTHNLWAPPHDFIKNSFLPAIAAADFKADCKLLKYGFSPGGGGQINFTVRPRHNSDYIINLCEPILNPVISAKIYTSKLPIQIAQKQQKMLLDSGLNIDIYEHIDVVDSNSAGNCIVIYIAGDNRFIICTGFGAKGKSSQKVVGEVANEAQDYLNSRAGIDHHLADQLVIYMAMQKKGFFTTNQLSKHLITNIEVIKKFLNVDFTVEQKQSYYRVCCS